MDSFEPKDADYQARVRASFDYSQSYAQQHGFLHAGIVASALDSACGYAAFSLMPADAAVLTIEFNINLLAPAKGERFLFSSLVVKPGRTITVCEGRAVAVDGKGENLVATMNGTMMAVFDRGGIRH